MFGHLAAGSVEHVTEGRSVNFTTALLGSLCWECFCTFAYIDKLKTPSLPFSAD